jgi:hypothetical protein
MSHPYDHCGGFLLEDKKIEHNIIITTIQAIHILLIS